MGVTLHPHRRGGPVGGGSDIVTVPTIAFGANEGFLLTDLPSTTDTFNSTITSTVSAGSNAVTIGGPGTLVFSGADGYAGTTTLNSGTLSLGSITAIPSGGGIVLTGGTLQTTSNFAASSGTPTLTLAGPLVHQQRGRLSRAQGVIIFSNTTSTTITLGGTNNLLTVAGGSVVTFADQIINGTTAGNLSKLGAGTLYLTDTNGAFASARTGQTTVGQGIVNVQIAAGFGTAVVVVANGAAVQVQAHRRR